MALPHSWLRAGGSNTMFGTDDWTALKRRGVTSAQQLKKLHDNQQYLAGPQRNSRGVVTHPGNKQGVTYQEGKPGGLFNRK